jgi:hypothetical protein
MPREWFTTAEAVERLHVSPDLLGDLIRGRALEAIDVSRPGSKRATWRISAAAMAAFEKSRKAVPMPSRSVVTRRRKKLAGVREYF